MELWVKYLDLVPENYLKGFIKLINCKIPGFRPDDSAKIPRRILKQTLIKKNHILQLKEEAERLAKKENILNIDENELQYLTCDSPEKTFTYSFVLINSERESLRRKALQLIQSSLQEENKKEQKSNSLQLINNETKSMKLEITRKEQIYRDLQSKTSKEISELKKENKKLYKELNIIKKSLLFEKQENRKIAAELDELLKSYNDVSLKLQHLTSEINEKQLKINDLNAKLLNKDLNINTKKTILIGMPPYNLKLTNSNDFEFLKDENIRNFLESNNLEQYDNIYIIKSELQNKNFIQLRRALLNIEYSVFENANELSLFIKGI
ncbi:MAG: hypothetical protein K0S34_1894 [Bacillales bacterium]|nr:hypothetical protein [Bacillales bacterium]